MSDSDVTVTERRKKADDAEKKAEKAPKAKKTVAPTIEKLDDDDILDEFFLGGEESEDE